MPEDFDPTDSETTDRNDDAADRMVRIWRQALAEIQAKLAEAADTLGEGFTVDMLRQIEAEIVSIIQDAGDVSLEELQANLQDELAAIQSEFESTLGPSPGLTDFVGVSQELIGLLADQGDRSIESIEEAARRVGTNFSDSLRQLQLDALVQSEIQGESIEERKRRIIDALEKTGEEIPETWRGSVESYAEMVARTNLAEASRLLTLAKAEEYGVEVFQVSIHGATDACAAFEGRLVSRDGKGEGVSMSVAELYASRPYIFHPNCRHRLLPYDADFATAGRKRSVAIANATSLPDERGLKDLNNAAAKLRRAQERDKDSLVDDQERANLAERLGEAA